MSDIVVISRWDGRFSRRTVQPTTNRKPLTVAGKFNGNQYTSRRLVAAIQSSSSLSEAARRIGSTDLFLAELKRWTERTAA